MSSGSGIDCSSGSAAAGVERPVGRRPRRVALLLVLVWMLGAFDLIFTIMAYRIGGFKEANPLADLLLHSSGGLIAFKIASLAVGTTILFILRRRRAAEVACWLICAAYTILSVMWLIYYRQPPGPILPGR